MITSVTMMKVYTPQSGYLKMYIKWIHNREVLFVHHSVCPKLLGECLA